MTVDEIYLQIAQEMVKAIADDAWTSARLEFELTGNGVVGYTGDYSIGATKHDISVRKISREIRSRIKALHEITTGGEHNKWNRAVFTLAPDGKFDMAFIWDQELHDEVEKLGKE